MADNIMDQIVAELREQAPALYPQYGTLRGVRVVGHTPKSDHFIYDLAVDFESGGVRLAAKLYKSGKAAHNARKAAHAEQENIRRVWDLFAARGLDGVPRPVGDFSEHGAVVTEKIPGLPLQSIIMKAALLPGDASVDNLYRSARMAGEWLRQFHAATGDGETPFDGATLVRELEMLCGRCKAVGLDDASIRTIVEGAHYALETSPRELPAAAVLHDFTPLNILIGDEAASVADFSRMRMRGVALEDAAEFLACVEALEKYPFCDRRITTVVQESFTDAYGVSDAEEPILRVLKMRRLLGMFAQGRIVKETAVRKQVMWANVMKRFIQQAAQRSLSPAA